MDFREAEAAALAWMRTMDFVGARLTPGGADGGIDVTADSAVAQVKAEAKPTGRPAVQRIHGVAASQGKKALFFSTSAYTNQASEWADEAGVALFVLAADLTVRSFNVHGQRIVTSRMVTTGSAAEVGSVALDGHAASFGSTGISMQFTLAECGSCGKDSPIAAGCQHCGTMPAREDLFVAARRRSIETARARIGSASVAPTDVTAGDNFVAFIEADSVNRQIALIAAIDGAGSEWQSSYAANIRTFERIKTQGLRSSMRSSSIWAPIWPQLDQILQAATEAVDAFERGGIASTPDLAASYIQAGQEAVDRMVALADALGDDARRRTQDMQRGEPAGATTSGLGCVLPSVFAGLSVLLVLFVFMM